MRAKICLLVGLTYFCAISCGKSDGEEEPNPETTAEGDLPDGVGAIAVDGLNSLPDITASVEANADGDSEAATFDGEGGDLTIDDFELVADSGISLGTDTTQSALEGIDDIAYGACEMVNRTRGFLTFAAQADELECMLSFMMGDTETYYDGEWHLLDLVDEDEVTRFRFKITGEKDAVTGLEAQVCYDGQQELYLQKVIDEGQAQIRAKTYSEPDNPQVDKFLGLVEVTGTVDDAGKFDDLKLIKSDYSNEFSAGNSSYVREVVKESSQNIQYVGHLDNGDKVDRIIAFVNLINSNGDDQYILRELELGDGSMVFGGEGDDGVVQAWEGDDPVVNTSLNIADKVSSFKGQLPGAPDEQTLAFEGDQEFDCTGEAEFAIALDTLVKLTKANNPDYETLSEEEDEEEEGEGPEFPICHEFWLPQNQYIECSEFTDETGD